MEMKMGNLAQRRVVPVDFNFDSKQSQADPIRFQVPSWW